MEQLVDLENEVILGSYLIQITTESRLKELKLQKCDKIPPSRSVNGQLGTVDLNAIESQPPISKKLVLRECSEEDKMTRLDWLMDMVGDDNNNEY